MACEGVGAAEWDYAKNGSGLASFRSQALKNFMDGAVASTGKDYVCAATGGISCLDGRRAGSSGSRELDAMAKGNKSLSDLAQLRCATMPVAA